MSGISSVLNIEVVLRCGWNFLPFKMNSNDKLIKAHNSLLENTQWWRIDKGKIYPNESTGLWKKCWRRILQLPEKNGAVVLKFRGGKALKDCICYKLCTDANHELHDKGGNTCNKAWVAEETIKKKLYIFHGARLNLKTEVHNIISLLNLWFFVHNFKPILNS